MPSEKAAMTPAQEVDLCHEAAILDEQVARSIATNDGNILEISSQWFWAFHACPDQPRKAAPKAQEKKP